MKFGDYISNQKKTRSTKTVDGKEENVNKKEKKEKIVTKKGKIPPQFLKNIKKGKTIKEEFGEVPFIEDGEEIDKSLLDFLKELETDNPDLYRDIADCLASKKYPESGVEDVGDLNDLEPDENLDDDSW